MAALTRIRPFAPTCSAARRPFCSALHSALQKHRCFSAKSPMICEKAAAFLCPARKFRSGMRSPMQADASKHAPSRHVSRHTLSVSGRFRCAVASPLPLVVYSPPTVQKDALAQNNNANAARSTPTIRVGTAPHSPRKPQKARRCGSVDGLFRRVGQRLPTFFISGCVPKSGKCA